MAAGPAPKTVTDWQTVSPAEPNDWKDVTDWETVNAAPAPKAGPGATQRFTTSALAPITGAVTGTYHAIADQPRTPTEKVVNMALPGGLAAKRALVDPQIEQLKEAYRKAKEGRYSEALGHSVAAAVPVFGPWAAQFGETEGKQLGAGDYAGAAGTAAGNAALFVAPKAIKTAKEMAGSGVRAVTGTGPRAISDVVEKTQEAIAKAEAARPGELKEFHQKTSAAKVAADQRAAAASRKTALQSGVRTLSDKFQTDLKALREDARVKADAKYVNLNKYLGELPANPEGLQSALGDAQGKITGSDTNPAIFKDILGRLKEGNPIQYKDLQGYYAELGRELSKGSLPGDVYTAYSSLQESIGGEMQKIADSKGMGAQLADARNSWRNLKQTFYDPKSPLKKALDAKEAGGAIKTLSGKDRTGIEALAKYDPQLAQRANVIRGYAEEAAKTKIPAESTKPAPKLAPKTPPKTISEGDITGAKAKGLDKRANQIRHAGTYSAVWPLFYVVKQAIGGHSPNLLAAGAEAGGTALAAHALASVLEKPSVVKFLTKATEKDVASIPQDLRGSLPTIVKSAQSRGMRVNPVVVHAAQAAIFMAPRNPTDAWQSQR